MTGIGIIGNGIAYNYNLDTTLAGGGIGSGGYGMFDVIGGSLTVGGNVAAGSVGSGGFGFTVAPGPRLRSVASAAAGSACSISGRAGC